MSQSEYVSNGINLSPQVPTFGDKVKIQYDGILVKSGATEVFAHIGFGDDWSNRFDYKMSKSQNCFETSFPITNQSKLNVCFRDSANNWDNNLGKNYSFKVEQ